MVPFEAVFPIENGGYIPIAILVKTRGFVLAAKCPGTSRNLQEPPGTSRSLPKLFRLKPYQMGSRFWGQKIDIFNIFCCEVYNSPALQRFPTKRSTYPKRKSGSRVITSSWAMAGSEVGDDRGAMGFRSHELSLCYKLGKPGSLMVPTMVGWFVEDPKQKSQHLSWFDTSQLGDLVVNTRVVILGMRRESTFWKTLLDDWWMSC